MSLRTLLTAPSGVRHHKNAYSLLSQIRFASSSSSDPTATSVAESSTPSSSTPARVRKSPRAIRLQRAAERRVLPQVSHLSEFPDLSKPDPLLDRKTVTHIPASVKNPFSATVIEYAPEFGTSFRTDLPSSTSTSSTASEAELSKEDSQENARPDLRQARESRLPYSEDITGNLHRYPLVLKRVVHQTPKGRIASFYAMVVVGNGNGIMGIGEGKDAESGGGAQSKAYSEAIKGLDSVARFEDRTIFSDTKLKWGATQVRMWPRPAGFGLAVNPYIHQICKAAGIHDLSAKVIGSRNGMQVVKAAMMMLHGGSTPLRFGNGVGGKGRRLEAKEGIRGKDIVERERGRKLIEGSGWL